MSNGFRPLFVFLAGLGSQFLIVLTKELVGVKWLNPFTGAELGRNGPVAASAAGWQAAQPNRAPASVSQLIDRHKCGVPWTGQPWGVLFKGQQGEQRSGPATGW